YQRTASLRHLPVPHSLPPSGADMSGLALRQSNIIKPALRYIPRSGRRYFLGGNNDWYVPMDPVSIVQLSQVISHVVAPAFVLGAVASFISILVARMNGILDRIRSLNELPGEGHAKSALKADIPRLKQRAALLHRAIILAIGSGVVA